MWIQVKDKSTIIYTFTDEAPALATYSLLPIIEAFAGAADVEVETRDISLAGRILAAFPDRLTDDQRVSDALAELGDLALTPQANIIKLPNISASVPQLKAAIVELRAKGYDLPDYPDEGSSADAADLRVRYGAVMGSAVNPVLRQGNSDRRAPHAVKEYAKKHPHSMGAWSPDSKTHVATMSSGDFRSNEQSLTVTDDGAVRIEFVGADDEVTVLKATVPVIAGEVIDSTVMNVAALRVFLAEQIADAKAQGVLFSLHLKATMMKVSDPIMFGHAVEVFFAHLFEQHGEALDAAGANPRDGLGQVIDVIAGLPADERTAIEADARGRLRQRARRRDGRLRSGHHEPARAERRDRRRVDAGDDPHVRPDVEPRGSSRTPRPSSPTAAMPVCTRSSSRTASPTARSIRRPWAPCRTSA